MDTTLIGGILILLVVGLIIAVSISQLLEKQRVKRVRLQLMHHERIRKLESLIRGLPNDYFPKELRQVVFQSIVNSLNALKPHSDNVSKLEAQIDTIENHIAALGKQDQAGNKQTEIKNPQEIRLLLKELYSVIIEFHKSGLVSKDTASTYLNYTKKLILKLMVDKYSNAAEAALKSNKHKLALHYYGLAYQELLKQPNTKSHQQELMKFKSKIASLKIETTASGANKKVIAPDTASSEWLEYCAEQDAWKKKRLYD